MRDEQGREERFDEVVLACNANQSLMLLDRPSARERWLLGSVRYESELHNHAVVHTDGSVLGRDGAHAARDPQQLRRAVRRAPRQLRDHVHHAQPAALGEALGQAVPSDVQPGAPDRPAQGHRAPLVPARRARRLPRVGADERVPVRRKGTRTPGIAARTPS